MTTVPVPTPYSAATDSARASSFRAFFLARQPILDSAQALVGYELLFRTAAMGAAQVTDDLLATASVIANVAELGMHNVVGDTFAFLNVDDAVLQSDVINFLQPEQVILEILESVRVTPALVERVRQLAQQGFRFALDDVIAISDDVLQLLPLVDIVKIDLRQVTLYELDALAWRCKAAGKMLLAEKVETLGEFNACKSLGFDYFQGYYFATPVILTGRKLSSSQVTALRLIALLGHHADDAEIEQTIKQDASLSLHLLRMVNTPVAGVVPRIESLSQAIAVLGRQQLQRWLQILVYAEPRKSARSMPPLLTLATTRGKLLELIAQAIAPDQRALADKAFTVGILSLMDTLYGQSMTEVLSDIAVDDEVRAALEFRVGTLGELLKLSDYIEHIDDSSPQFMQAVQRIGLTVEQLNAMQLEAFEWSNAISCLT